MKHKNITSDNKTNIHRSQVSHYNAILLDINWDMSFKYAYFKT